MSKPTKKIVVDVTKIHSLNNNFVLDGEEVIKVKIVFNDEANLFHVGITLPVDKLKVIAQKYFFGSSLMDLQQNYQLISVRLRKRLDENKSLSELCIEDSG